METPELHTNRLAQHRRIALNIMLDEHAIDAIAAVLADLRERNDPAVADLEHAIRTHRIGIMKQRAILAAAGLDV